ncbi:hypothetical protein F511_16501 [Dorcoceras hygrometricum]|uniref:Uncharacterized protein n=1 Tax=Dorcoceras hygrometricum TaxID=472368 RepID=A0A2Z7BQI8_9LAMI|nr:hypothetical protein F511_16501 [Dorcoceras hygrometricum]
MKSTLNRSHHSFAQTLTDSSTGKTVKDQISPGVPAVGVGATIVQPDAAQPAVAPTDAVQPDGAQKYVAQTDLATQRPTSEAPVASTYQLIRQSGPRPEGRLLRQAALEGLTRSMRTDSPQKTDRSKSDQSTAGGGGVGGEGEGAAVL